MNEQPVPGSARRKKVVGTAKRLAIRAYLPMGGWLLSWFMIGLAVGHADAVRLLAVNAFVQAIRHVCIVEGMGVLGRRSGACKAVFADARKVALRIELGSLIACIAATALLASLFIARNLTEPAMMLAIAAGSIPARNPGALLVADRDRLSSWRIGSALTFAIASGLVLLLGYGWACAAAALALRDWGGLVATFLFAPKRQTKSRWWDEPVTFAEAARRTEASSRQRLSYRLISSLSSLVLGPVGNFAARTSREVGKLDSRLARLVPRYRSGFILFTLGTAATSLFFLFVAREPSTLLGAGVFARLAGSGGAVLLWWRYGGEAAEDEDMDDE